MELVGAVGRAGAAGEEQEPIKTTVDGPRGLGGS